MTALLSFLLGFTSALWLPESQRKRCRAWLRVRGKRVQAWVRRFVGLE